MKTALLFTANDAQLAAADLMLTTLRDPARGAYDQDIWVISTQLSEDAKAYLDNRGIRYHVEPMAWADTQIKWRLLFPGMTDKDALAAFHSYRNKRMSKLIYLDWFARHGSAYDAVAICDNDLYFQQDIRGLFQLAETGCINYAKEDYPIIPGTGLWKKDFRYRQYTGNWDYDGGDHEVNIGFIIARPEVMQQFFSEVRMRFRQLPPTLIRDHGWHDQDLARTLRHDMPGLFREFPADTILHLCGGGMDLVEEPQPGRFVNRLTGTAPRIVHFGGGAWKAFRSIAPAFKANVQDVFDNTNRRSSTPRKITVSSLQFDGIQRVLTATGWYVANTPDVSIILSTQDRGVLGVAQTGINRSDVAKRFPGTTEIAGGWSFSGQIPPLAKDAQITVALIANGEITHTFGVASQGVST